ncbi:hypothetical protein PIB30_052147 [Stylosanthes scabra]|uniref:Uncharacterized protein n=1 Tax=Stylosanthes scabra TaxID=79078 RepID=A0ABU6YHD6_9FABA|nr:hypothetical protein [Stylosanthes scabra]
MGESGPWMKPERSTAAEISGRKEKWLATRRCSLVSGRQEEDDGEGGEEPKRQKRIEKRAQRGRSREENLGTNKTICTLGVIVAVRDAMRSFSETTHGNGSNPMMPQQCPFSTQPPPVHVAPVVAIDNPAWPREEQ